MARSSRPCATAPPASSSRSAAAAASRARCSHDRKAAHHPGVDVLSPNLGNKDSKPAIACAGCMVAKFAYGVRAVTLCRPRSDLDFLASNQNFIAVNDIVNIQSQNTSGLPFDTESAQHCGLPSFDDLIRICSVWSLIPAVRSLIGSKVAIGRHHKDSPGHIAATRCKHGTCDWRCGGCVTFYTYICRVKRHR